MPYTISEATDQLKIKEQEYASATTIMFTAFPSCIGVIRPVARRIHFKWDGLASRYRKEWDEENT